jgi:hypothetical protein
VGQVGILEDCPLDAAPFDDVDTIKMDEFLNWRVPLNPNATNELHSFTPACAQSP